MLAERSRRHLTSTHLQPGGRRPQTELVDPPASSRAGFASTVGFIGDLRATQAHPTHFTFSVRSWAEPWRHRRPEDHAGPVRGSLVWGWAEGSLVLPAVVVATTVPGPGSVAAAGSPWHGPAGTPGGPAASGAPSPSLGRTSGKSRRHPGPGWPHPPAAPGIRSCRRLRTTWLARSSAISCGWPTAPGRGPGSTPLSREGARSPGGREPWRAHRRHPPGVGGGRGGGPPWPP